jgi:hypothetical protein
MLVPFVILSILTSVFSERFVSIGSKGVRHTIGAGFASLLAVILFNPFHLTNLTHTFVITLSKHAELWRSVREWRPAFEWNNPFGNVIPFLIMYIIVWVVLVIWAVVPVFTSRFLRRFSKQRTRDSDKYQWPRLDIALIVIVALTIYMAISSRRFIPIAAIASCPIIAMFIDQIIRTISAARSFYYKQNRLAIPPMPHKLQLFFTLACVVAVLVLGTSWAIKFKHIYLDTMPVDSKFNSIFMRMALAEQKPFNACKFIEDNKLKGKMFNHWTEGGFIAWCQQPDPNTGKTPLQLFIDGRAQAAYAPESYRNWSNIMIGGPTVKSARKRKHKLTAKDYAEIGQWIDKQLKKHNVWVVLMPRRQFNKPFVKGLENNPNWPFAYLDNEQKLFVDRTTPQGKELIQGISNGKTLYPDDFSKNLMLAHNIFLLADSKETEKEQRLDFAARGLDFAIQAFKLNPSLAPLQKIGLAERFAQLRPRVKDLFRDYVADFAKNKSRYAKQIGYSNKLVAAVIISSYLHKIAIKEKNTKLIQLYKARSKEYNNQLKQLVKSKTW